MLISFFTLIIVIIDQLSKFIIRNNLSQLQKLWLIEDYLYLTFLKNRGAAFGILQGQLILFFLITIFFFIFIIYLYQKELPQTFLVKIAISFLLGGSTSNLIDRILMKYVTDFIGLNLFDFYQLPIVNIADIFISTGVLILIYQLLFLADRGV